MNNKNGGNKMIKNFFNVLTGEPLPNEQGSSEKYNVPIGLAVMASDAISSVAYAGEEILKVLIGVAGITAYTYLGYTALAIIGLLALVTMSYMQIIKAYPQGGGAYIVAKENIGTKSGLLAGAGLIVSYILTVAVSASAGMSAMASAFPQLANYKVALVIALIVVLTILNLRGVGESSKIFSIPTYIFIFSMIYMIIYGLIKYSLNPSSITPVIVDNSLKHVGDASIFLLLSGFAQGCSALTGVEAVSNSVPNFKEPNQRNANIVMILLSTIILFIFGGSCLVARICQAVPNENMTVLALQQSTEMSLSIFDLIK
jgi:amino acid transporter